MTVEDALRQLIVNDRENAIKEFRQSFSDIDQYYAWLQANVELTDEERTTFERLTTEGRLYFLEAKYVIERSKANEIELQRQIKENTDRLINQLHTKNEDD